ncbi:hypothetical protein THAR02_03682 [Trichoderma harzianum]|uniref:Uncharacterized protein n=1 Tax=Trichoderma harzianum TaxID=5544 RepID=A0A0F9XGT8_TRIHA|nr:hypothetical protein THAR02_03682 [Trichoderma harzianum]
MVYEWEKHREAIFQLYIQDGLPLNQVMVRLASEHSFRPKKRALQTQIRKWSYLKKQHQVKPDVPPDRVRELWELNLSWLQIAQQLQQEGFQVTEQEVAKLGKAMGLYNRQGARVRSKSIQSGRSQPSPWSLDGAYSGDESMVPRRDSTASSIEDFTSRSREPGDAMSPNRITGHSLRRRKSEMTLTAAKRMLGIDDEKIAALRNTFTAICNRRGIRSKSHTTEKWDEAIRDLLHEHPELYPRVGTSPENVERNMKALHIMCRNFAKTERLGPKMTQTDAKNALGLNPEEARVAREIMIDLLKHGGFGDKLAVTPTPDAWESLMDRWGAGYDKIGRARALIRSGNDPDEKKQKALVVLSRDVLKRLRDDRPSRQAKRKSVDDMDTLHSQRLHVDNTDGNLYAGELETQPQQNPQSSFDGAGVGNYSPMKTFDNVPESPFTFQATSSADTGTMNSYQPVQPSSGNFPLHETRIYGFQGHLNMALPDMSQYQPPPEAPLPGFAHASFTGAPYATQSHGNASFHAVAPGQWTAADTLGVLGGPLNDVSDGTMTLANGQGHFESHAWAQTSGDEAAAAYWQQLMPDAS